METFLRSIGVENEVLEHLDRAVLAFQRPAVLWIGLALLIPIGIFIYRRQRDNLATVPRGYRIALSVTRIVVLAILIFVLAGPYLKIDHQVTKRPILAVLFDASQSMQLRAGPFRSEAELKQVAEAAGYEVADEKVDPQTRKALNRIGRADLAQAVVRSAYKDLIKPLEEEYEIRYYTFAREAEAVAFDPTQADAESVVPEGGSASHIGDAIHHVLDEAAGRQVSGILLLTDGQNTGGRSPSQAARAAAESQTPIFVAALGSAERVQDVALVDVYTSGLVAIGDTVRVHATIESQGFDKRPVKVELKDGDEVLDTKQVVVRDAEQQQVELTFEAKNAGARYLSVSIPAQKEETEELKANNTDAAFVRISSEKIRVLLIDGRPRWDFRFVKNAIRRDNGLAGRDETPDVVLENEWRRLPEKQQAEALPRSLEDLAKYHTLIIGDASPALLDDAFLELVARAVQEKGVGLIVQAGTESMPHRYGSAFQDLLPVRMRGKSAGLEAPVYKPFRMEISPDGIVHETMRLYDDPGRNQNVWARMRPYYWCAAVERPAPGATVLAWNPSLESRFGKMPLIAHHYAGDGKVLFVGTDSTWLWRQNVGDRFFYKFWGQAIRFVARRDEEDKKSRIEVRPIRAQPGEEAQIELITFKAGGAPEEAPAQTITLLGPGSRQTLKLTADKARKGRYIGKFTPEKPGVHRLAFQPPSGGEAVEAAIQVLRSPAEFRHPNRNQAAVEALASTTGGKVLPFGQLGVIPKQIRGETELKKLHREATIWDNWLTLLVLVMTYSIDVGIRRLMGLS